MGEFAAEVQAVLSRHETLGSGSGQAPGPRGQDDLERLRALYELPVAEVVQEHLQDVINRRVRPARGYIMLVMGWDVPKTFLRSFLSPGHFSNMRPNI